MFAALAITILISLQSIDAEHNLGSKNYRFPSKKLILSEPSFDNATLFYALCDQPSPKQCTVVRELNPFTMAAETKKCDVNLKADDVQLIVAFGNDKAILVTLESKMLKTTTVHMSSCKTVDAELFEIPADWQNLQLYRKFVDVVTFNGGFQLVVKGLSEMCSQPNENKYCSFDFDAEGKRMEGPYVWPKINYVDINVVSPIITDAGGQGYFFVNEKSSLIGIQADRAGGPTYVKLWGPHEINSELARGGQSAANNANGACYASNSTIKCWRNDAEGGLEMSTEFTFKHEHDIWNLFVHNLPEGGFIVLMVTCPDRVCTGDEDHYYLMKIDAQGNTVSRVEVDMKRSLCNAKNGVILAKTFVDKYGLYCAARLCHSHTDKEAKLETLYDCYSKDDFLN